MNFGGVPGASFELRLAPAAIHRQSFVSLTSPFRCLEICGVFLTNLIPLRLEFRLALIPIRLPIGVNLLVVRLPNGFVPLRKGEECGSWYVFLWDGSDLCAAGEALDDDVLDTVCIRPTALLFVFVGALLHASSFRSQGEGSAAASGGGGRENAETPGRQRGRGQTSNLSIGDMGVQ